jgi:Uma2 family endonuclease
MPLALDRPPKTILEVLSPGTSKVDLTKKKSVYESEGVKEYWVVDPKTRLARGFRLSKGKFSEFKSENGKVNSALLKQVFKF